MKRDDKKEIIESLIGKKIVRWTVNHYAGRQGRYKRHFLNCTCECGKNRDILLDYLIKGTTKSCGCLRPLLGRELHTTHGHSRILTGSYRSWKAMFARCYQPRNPNYKYYGAIGIVVCQRWRQYENFLEDMGNRPDGLTLDRINPYGDYGPSNCRWATWAEQNLNKRKKDKK